MSTLINGYSLPSSHFTDSLLPRVERVRNWKSLVTSWNTTSRYSGWMPAFIGTHQLCGKELGSIPTYPGQVQARVSPSGNPGGTGLPGRQCSLDEAFEPGLVVAHHDRRVVGRAATSLPIHHSGAAAVQAGQLDCQRAL